MIAVLFELEPKAGRASNYFDLAEGLKAQLQTIDGFISIERFESVNQRGKFLSLSFWRDEDAVARWRNWVPHRAAQSEGRASIFNDYRLRVATVIRDYGMRDRAQVPKDSALAD